jgi:hypothetical protein
VPDPLPEGGGAAVVPAVVEGDPVGAPHHRTGFRSRSAATVPLFSLRGHSIDGPSARTTDS